ncbi:MAG: prolyl oligopeptidase family serine peptidase [Verrucomicrobia bacterium]|nr:prolyl oligopeptidase family serine peptidase [Verrucomicrobiota bacterium]
MKIYHGPSGIRFGMLGRKRASPAPTLFVFASRIEETLNNLDFNKVGRLLRKRGYLSVTLDVPCHGENVIPDEPTSIPGWRRRIETGAPFIAEFTTKTSTLLDHLVKEGYTDAHRVIAIGTSRGGFLALHWMATEPRVKCVAAFAPVADLRDLTEFAGMENHPGARSVALDHCVERLAGRSIWVCIGNNDLRVSTDRCVAFTRKVVAASVAQKKRADVELHVMVTEGHAIHPTAHDEVAAWILARMKET